MNLAITLLLIVASLMSTRYCANKSGAFSPISIFLSVFTLNQVAYFYFSYLYHLPYMQNWWMLSMPLRSTSLITHATYTAMICFTAAFSPTRSGMPLNSMLRLDGDAARVISSSLIGLLFIIAVFHASVVDIDSLLKYRPSSISGYQLSRSSDYVGITGGLPSLIHRTIPFLGIISAALAAYSLYRRNIIWIAFSITSFFYFFVVTISFTSRFSLIQVLVLCVGPGFMRGRVSPASVMTGMTTVILLYAGIVGTRIAAGPGKHGDFGLTPVLSNVIAMPIEWLHLVSHFILVNFGGPFKLSATYMLADGYEPSLLYKVLSFSPLPSSVLNFENLRATEQFRINATSPISSIAELVIFGPLWFVSFMVIQAVSLRYITKNLSHINMPAQIAALGLLFYYSVSFHHYNIKATSRWLFVAIIIVGFFQFMSRGSKNTLADQRT
jgi:hypothetical protein